MRVVGLAGLCVAVGLMSMGCPQSAGVAKVTTVFTADSGSTTNALISAFAKATEVDVADIESLKITITAITLDYSGNAGDMEEGENEDGSSKIVVFSGSEMVDLVELQGVNRLISLDEAPAGKYTKIRISFQDPVLVLKSDPNTEHTNIQITANGNLFISQMFNLPEGQQSVLEIDFGGLHLVMQGNGDYTLTPQLQVDLAVGEIVDTTVMGMITAIDTDTDMFTMMVEGGELVVDYMAAAIFLPDDTDMANGDESSLMVGQKVEVMGGLYPDDVLEATSVKILPEEPPMEEPMP